MLSYVHSKIGLVSMLLLSSFPAHAYLDPGTGSVILQAIIATVVTGIATMRLWWDKLLSLFSIRKDKSNEEKISRNSDSEQENK